MSTISFGPLDVDDPQSIQVIVEDYNNPGDKLRMAIYTGTLNLEKKNIKSSGALDRYSIEYLVCHRNRSVDAWRDNTAYVDAVTVAAPASFYVFGKPHLVAVDRASSNIVPKVLKGVNFPNPAWVLMLTADLAMINGNFLRLSYQVTVLYRWTGDYISSTPVAGSREWNGQYSDFRDNLEESHGNPTDDEG